MRDIRCIYTHASVYYYTLGRMYIYILMAVEGGAWHLQRCRCSIRREGSVTNTLTKGGAVYILL